MKLNVDTTPVSARRSPDVLPGQYISYLLRVLIAGAGLALCAVSLMISLPFYIVEVITRKAHHM